MEGDKWKVVGDKWKVVGDRWKVTGTALILVIVFKKTNKVNYNKDSWKCI